MAVGSGRGSRAFPRRHSLPARRSWWRGRSERRLVLACLLGALAAVTAWPWRRHDAVDLSTSLGRAAAADVAPAAEAPSKDVLVFNRYGDTYFLSEVETASEQTARELFPSRKERHLRQQMAKNMFEPQTVEVACN